jgi:hypothetical protein
MTGEDFSAFLKWVSQSLNPALALQIGYNLISVFVRHKFRVEFDGY